MFGDATLAVASDGSVVLSADGPAFAVWRLAGVRVPASLPATSEQADEVSRGVASAETYMRLAL